MHAAAKKALARLGTSSHASRSTSGDTSLLHELESLLASVLRTEAAVVLPDGYTANIAAVKALAGPGLTAVIDESAHPSLAEAAAGLTIRRYKHASVPAALALARRCRRCLVMTDTVFGAKGTIAPLEALASGLPDHAVLLADDAHGLGAVGPRGATAGLHREGLIITGSLAKGMGAHGGFVAGARTVVAAARRTMAFISTTPVPPPSAAAAIESLRIIAREPGRFDRLASNAAALRRALRPAFPELEASHIPIAVGGSLGPAAIRSLHDHLLSRGIFIPIVDYPGGSGGASLRASVTSEHSPGQLQRLTREVEAWAQRHLGRTSLALRRGPNPVNRAEGPRQRP